MLVPQVHKRLSELDNESQSKRSVIIVGIESHICVTQTALDLKREGRTVYVIADGVSSCNAQEVPIALARLRAEGVIVTTSESIMYEITRDASSPSFRDIAALVKQYSSRTKEVLGNLCSLEGIGGGSSSSSKI